MASAYQSGLPASLHMAFQSSGRLTLASTWCCVGTYWECTQFPYPDHSKNMKLNWPQYWPLRSTWLAGCQLDSTSFTISLWAQSCSHSFLPLISLFLPTDSAPNYITVPSFPCLWFFPRTSRKSWNTLPLHIMHPVLLGRSTKWKVLKCLLLMCFTPGPWGWEDPLRDPKGYPFFGALNLSSLLLLGKVLMVLVVDPI